VLVTYDVTRLMRLSGPKRFLVTLGGRERVDPTAVIAEMIYDHPLHTPESVAAQSLLPTIDDDHLVFAGGWGFHEDGAASGLRAVQRLGARWGAARTLESVPC
jgi:predicted NAD/FAD-binding protein